MIAFIDDHRAAYGLEPRSGQTAQRRSDHAKRDTALQADIQRVFTENFEIYGARKIWRQMRREGRAVASCTVERRLRTMALQGAVRGKPVRTMISDKVTPCPLDHVRRQFKAPEPEPNRL